MVTMQWIVPAMLLMASATAKHAEAAEPYRPPTREVFTIGLGKASCSLWPSISGDGQWAWVAGFWDASNFWKPDNSHVGQTTNMSGLVGEVALACKNDPSISIFSASVQAYEKLEQLNR